MLRQRNGLSLQSQLRPFSVLIFHLLLTHSVTGQTQLIGSPQPIVATVGDDIILACHLEPAADITAMTLDWTRSDLDPRFVYVRRFGQDLVHTKHPSYKGRTSLFTDELKRGNISLKLCDVRPSDAGRYRCFIPRLNIDSFIELVVGAASPPVIILAGIDRDKGGVALQCESAGWYPEPEVLWLDGEGKLLSAGPTETVRGPDDLYTVSSRVTVEKRHSNSFTCRVQQRNINQTRETHISMSDDFLKVQSSSSSTITALAVSLAVCILLILLVVFFVWKRRHNRTKTKRSPSDQAETGGEEMKPLEGKEKKSKHWPLVSRRTFLEEQQRREEAETQVQRKEQELQEKTQELQGEHARREEAERQVQMVEQELQKKTQELQEEKKSRKEFEEKVKTLEQELQNKITQLQQEKTKNTKLEKEVTTLKQDIKMKDTQLQEKTNANLEKEVTTLKQELQNRNTQEAETKRQLDTKTSELRKLQTELQEKNINLEKEVKTLKQVIQMKNKQLQDEHARREEVEKQVQRKQQELQKKTQELQLQTQLKVTAQSEVKDLKNQLETKKTEMEGKQPETIRQLPQGQEEAQSEVKDLKNQLETKIKEFEKQLQEEKKKNTELEKDVKTLKEELQNKNTQLEKQLQEEKKKKTELEKELETLKEEQQNKDRQGVRRRGWSFWRKRRS